MKPIGGSRMRRSPAIHTYRVTISDGVYIPVLNDYYVQALRETVRKAITLDALTRRMTRDRDWEYRLLPFAHRRRRVLARDDSHRNDILASYGSERVTVWTIAELRERLEQRQAKCALRVLARA